MAEVSSKAEFNAPARVLWGIVSDFGGVSKYNPIVTKVITEGTGVGSKRTCTIQIPSQKSFDVDEILENQDDNKMSVVIKIIQAPPPFSGMVVRVQVSELEQNKSQVEWVIDFQPGEIPEANATKAVESLVGQLADAYKEYLKNGGVS